MMPDHIWIYFLIGMFVGMIESTGARKIDAPKYIVKGMIFWPLILLNIVCTVLWVKFLDVVIARPLAKGMKEGIEEDLEVEEDE